MSFQKDNVVPALGTGFQIVDVAVVVVDVVVVVVDLFKHVKRIFVISFI